MDIVIQKVHSFVTWLFDIPLGCVLLLLMDACPSNQFNLFISLFAHQAAPHVETIKTVSQLHVINDEHLPFL